MRMQICGLAPRVRGTHVEAYEHPTDPLKGYVVVKNDIGADVIHLRGFDTHETVHLSPGLYEIRRQREYTPEGYRRAAD